MIGSRIDIAAAYLRGGNVVAMPTETVYGLAGNALDEDAVVKIFSVKNRPKFDPLIIHLADKSKISTYANFEDELLIELAEKFMPGPLTLLLDKKDIIPDLVTSGSARVAVRIPQHQVAQDLLSILDFPLAAPSANPFGYISPTTAQHVEDQLGSQIPYILEGGPASVGVESSIVGKEGDQYIVYRKGGLPVEAIQEIIPNITVRDVSTSQPSAPGMLHAHYAPSCKLMLNDVHNLSEYEHLDKVGALVFGELVQGIKPSLQFNLSTSKDLVEAARNLFKGMRYLDRLQLDVILAYKVPDKGIGRAINDRLTRAAYPSK